MKIACFFSNETKELLLREQYSIQDINILHDLGYAVKIATSFNEIPWGCGLYFSWWASGSILPLIKAKLLNKPIIVVAGGNDAMLTVDRFYHTPIGYLAAPWYKKIAARVVLKCSDAVVIPSKFMDKDVRYLGALEPILVYNSVNTELFNYRSCKKKYVTTIFNSDGGVSRTKRAINFIRSIPSVLKYCPDQQFVIIGNKGDAYNDLMNTVEKLGVSNNVRFLGTMPNTDVVTWMQASKLYVQISETETFGVAIAEAMSCGVPVVVSRRGAIPEVVGDLGFYVDHNQPESISSGIIDALKLKDKERMKLGIETRKRIIHMFSYERRKNAIKKIIDDLESS